MILLLFVVGVMALVYFVQTTFLDDFYKANKVKSLQSVGNSIADIIADDDFEDVIEHVAMSNEVCVRVVSNNENYSYTGACTLRGIDNNTINAIAAEVDEEDNKDKNEKKYLCDIEYNKWTLLLFTHKPVGFLQKPQFLLYTNDLNNPIIIDYIYPNFGNQKINKFGICKGFTGDIENLFVGILRYNKMRNGAH